MAGIVTKNLGSGVPIDGPRVRGAETGAQSDLSWPSGELQNPPSHQGSASLLGSDRLGDLFTRHLGTFQILDDVRLAAPELEARTSAAEALFAELSPHSARQSPRPLDLGRLAENVRTLSIEYLEALAGKMAESLRGKISEDIGSVTSRYPGKLEGCLSPLVRFQLSGESDLALAQIFYGLVKNHPFFDGNKKFAAAFAIDMIERSGGRVPDSTIANAALWVAQAPSAQPEAAIANLQSLFHSFLMTEDPSMAINPRTHTSRDIHLAFNYRHGPGTPEASYETAGESAMSSRVEQYVRELYGALKAKFSEQLSIGNVFVEPLVAGSGMLGKRAFLVRLDAEDGQSLAPFKDIDGSMRLQSCPNGQAALVVAMKTANSEMSPSPILSRAGFLAEAAQLNLPEHVYECLQAGHKGSLVLDSQLRCAFDAMNVKPAAIERLRYECEDLTEAGQIRSKISTNVGDVLVEASYDPSLGLPTAKLVRKL
jgi:prophage maintenance system killer protein